MSENVLDDVSKEGILSCIRSKTLGEWECEDPKKRISFEESNGKSGSKSDMLLKKDLPKSIKMKLKGGGFVDPVRKPWPFDPFSYYLSHYYFLHQLC